jgi:hypothetical protein
VPFSHRPMKWEVRPGQGYTQRWGPPAEPEEPVPGSMWEPFAANGHGHPLYRRLVWAGPVVEEEPYRVPDQPIDFTVTPELVDGEAVQPAAVPDHECG